MQNAFVILNRALETIIEVSWWESLTFILFENYSQDRSWKFYKWRIYFFLNKTCLFLLETPLRINYEEFLFFKTFQKSVFWVRNEVGNLKHVSSIWTVLVHLVNGNYSHLNTPLGCLNVQLWCFMILQVFEQFSSAFLAFFHATIIPKTFLYQTCMLTLNLMTLYLPKLNSTKAQSLLSHYDPRK